MEVQYNKEMFIKYINLFLTRNNIMLRDNLDHLDNDKWIDNKFIKRKFKDLYKEIPIIVFK